MPGYRGRLLNPTKVEIYRLSHEGIDADPDGAGPLTSGYDPVFREPILQSMGGSDVLGAPMRVELASILLPAQVEDRSWDDLRMQIGGDNPVVEVTLVFHFADLEFAGLVDVTSGDALLRKGDRLGAIRNYTTEALIQSVRTPPGLYATHVQPRSFGLSGGTRNLLAVVFQSRDVSTDTPGG